MLAQPARLLLAVSGLLVACSGNQEPDTSGPMPQTSNIDTDDPSDSAPPTTGGPTTFGETTANPTTESDDPTTEPLTSTTIPPATCGDGVPETGEACDDGNDDDTDECTHLCEPPTCNDGIKSGLETDKDCGGNCTACAANKACRSDGDCESDMCEANLCDPGCIAWRQQWGSPGDDSATDIAADATDSLYISGRLDDDASGFVKKFDAAGKQQWTRDIAGTSGAAAAVGLHVDAAGDILVVGAVQSKLEGQVSLGMNDAFIVKYDPAGKLLWTRQFGSSGNDGANAVTTDSAGNILVAGNSDGTIAGNVNVGTYDAVLSKFDAKGAPLWTRTLGSLEIDAAFTVATAADNDIVIAGFTQGAFDGLDWGGSYDVFIVKFNAAGAKQWSRQLGNDGDDYAGEVTIDKDDAIYLAGAVTGSLEGTPAIGLSDGFLRKYDPSGKILWTRQFGSSADEDANSVVLDPSGDLLISGLTTGKLADSFGGYDLYATKFTPDGARQWTHQVGGKADDYNPYIAVLSTGEPVLAASTTGTFAKAVNGDPDAIATLLCIPP